MKSAPPYDLDDQNNFLAINVVAATTMCVCFAPLPIQKTPYTDTALSNPKIYNFAAASHAMNSIPQTLQPQTSTKKSEVIPLVED